MPHTIQCGSDYHATSPYYYTDFSACPWIFDSIPVDGPAVHFGVRALPEPPPWTTQRCLLLVIRLSMVGVQLQVGGQLVASKTFTISDQS